MTVHVQGMTDVDERERRIRWNRITCAESEEHLQLMGDAKFVYSSLTDIDGEYGEPRIETIWGRRETPDEPILKNVRHPDPDGGRDVASCEHWFAEVL